MEISVFIGPTHKTYQAGIRVNNGNRATISDVVNPLLIVVVQDSRSARNSKYIFFETVWNLLGSEVLSAKHDNCLLLLIQLTETQRVG